MTSAPFRSHSGFGNTLLGIKAKYVFMFSTVDIIVEGRSPPADVVLARTAETSFFGLPDFQHLP